LQAYQRILSEIEALGARLLAISPQTPDHSLSAAEKNALEFEVLIDAGNHVARQFGLVFPLAEALRPIYRQAGGIDLSIYNGDDSWELPIPGTFVIGRGGVIRLAFVDADYTRRLEPTEILTACALWPNNEEGLVQA
jgi:peroxiredoxin